MLKIQQDTLYLSLREKRFRFQAVFHAFDNIQTLKTFEFTKVNVT